MNQDSGWDVPQSPEPGGKDSNGAPMAPVWKPTVNNGKYKHFLVMHLII